MSRTAVSRRRLASRPVSRRAISSPRRGVAAAASQPYYLSLIDGGYNLSLLVYSGDDDSVCGTIGTQSWIWDLGPATVGNWSSWSLGGQVAGYVQVAFRVPALFASSFSSRVVPFFRALLFVGARMPSCASCRPPRDTRVARPALFLLVCPAPPVCTVGRALGSFSGQPPAVLCSALLLLGATDSRLRLFRRRRDLLRLRAFRPRRFRAQRFAGLSFATVHGAGHEVPTYKPAQALELISAYFDKAEWLMGGQ